MFKKVCFEVSDLITKPVKLTMVTTRSKILTVPFSNWLINIKAVINDTDNKPKARTSKETLACVSLLLSIVFHPNNNDIIGTIKRIKNIDRQPRVSIKAPPYVGPNEGAKLTTIEPIPIHTPIFDLGTS